MERNSKSIGINLDSHVWADVQELIAGMNMAGNKITMDILEEITRNEGNNKGLPGGV